MSKRKKIIIIAAVILILVARMLLGSGNKAVPNYTSAKVDRGDVEQTVSATGAVEAIQKVDLKFVDSGKIAEINVKAGSAVKGGDVLAKLDVSKLDSQMTQSLAAKTAAQANLQALLEGASTEDVRVAQTGVDNARIALVSSQQSLDNTRLSAERDTASAQTALASAQLSLTNTKASNENSLNNAYAVAWDTVVSSLTAVDDALDANDKVLDSDDAHDTLSVRNTQYLYAAEASRVAADRSRRAAEDFVRANASSQSPANVDAAISKAQTALTDAQKALSDTYDVLGATVTSAELTQAELDGLKASVSTQRTSMNSGILGLNAKKLAISTQKVANQTALDSAQSAVDTATRSLSSVQAAAAAKVSAAENAVAAQEGALRQAEEQLAQVKAKPSSAKVAALRADVDQATASIELIQGQIDDSSIKAPYDGVVTNVTGEVGEIASVSEPVVSMMIPNGFQIVSNISEVSISKVKVGDEVVMDFDALGADQSFTGKVSEIDPAQTEISGVVYYKITTVFTADGEVVKPGMTANLDIRTAKKENVLRIPFQALKEKDGKKYVQTVDAKTGAVNDLGVEVGLRGDSYYEILGGLTEGQEIATFIQSN